MKESRFKTYRWTLDSRTYNRLHRRNKTDCAYCSPNMGCNARSKGKRTYWESTSYNFDGSVRSQKSMQYPSWKLATKNRKQWMKKKYIENETHHITHLGSYVYRELTWERSICTDRYYERLLPTCWR